MKMGFFLEKLDNSKSSLVLSFFIKIWIFLFLVSTFSYSLIKKESYYFFVDRFLGYPFVSFQIENFSEDVTLSFQVGKELHTIELQRENSFGIFRFIWKNKIYIVDAHSEVWYPQNANYQRKLWKIKYIYECEEEKKGLLYFVTNKKEYRRIFLSVEDDWYSIKTTKSMENLYILTGYPVYHGVGNQKSIIYGNAFLNIKQDYFLVDYKVEEVLKRKLYSLKKIYPKLHLED